MRERMSRRVKMTAAAAAVVMLAGASTLLALGARPARQTPPAATPAAFPWTHDQMVEPADLVKELAKPAAARPAVVCVGFPFLYRNGHIQGASLHGPTRTPEGVADLKAWAKDLPRTAGIVIYCGCCPMTQCPNVQPAFTALREMGFTHVRVLDLPKNFATDWVGKGYPIQKP